MTLEEQEQFVCNQLKIEREKKNLSQLELSFESGVSQNMITYIENCKRTPTLSTILKLCNALKINPSVLFPQGEIEKDSAKRIVIELIERFM
ncbi:MAG: helix-turn-helix domain-containing protein [Spirochaetia bacterium]|nr:helix-turn-helix domain-containing protein [Spirochaetia bacterium]